MSFTIRHIDHLVLRVADLERMLRFYGEVLGCRVERQLDDVGLVQLRAGASMIDLVPVDSPLGRAGGGAAQPQARNMDHFCLRVEPFDESEIRRHLQAHGVDAGPTETRFGAEGNGPSIYLHDPEGNTVELKGPSTKVVSQCGTNHVVGHPERDANGLASGGNDRRR